MNIRCNLLLLGLVFSHAASAAIDWEADLRDRDRRALPQSHCHAGEFVVASCKFRSKVASICASSDLSSSRGHVQYRYGKLGKVELEIPKAGTAPGTSIAYVDMSGASDSTNYYRFLVSDYRYFVYTASTRIEDDPDTGASQREEVCGIAVFRGKKKIHSDETRDYWDHRFFLPVERKAVPQLDRPEEVDPISQ